MPEDFPNGQKGINRLPAVSPLMYSTTEAKLPNQTPGKTSPSPHPLRCRKTCHYGAERNRKIDALCCAPIAKPPTFPNSLRSIKQWGVETSAFLRFSPKARRLDPLIPRRWRGKPIPSGLIRYGRMPHREQDLHDGPPCDGILGYRPRTVCLCLPGS